ncbi:MAG TPA: DUF4468 domain-containing protein [Bacteroidales bacterium]|nr:DUF4468 domain-containing protein [Bacteroidales bacterium]
MKDNIFSVSMSNLTCIANVYNTDKTDLYNKAKRWVIKTFGSEKNVILVDDLEKFRLVVSGSIPYVAFNPGAANNFSGFFTFTLTISIKDDGYKCSFDDISHVARRKSFSGGSFANERGAGGYFTSKKQWEHLKDTGFSNIKYLVSSLSSEMLKSSDQTGQ